MIEAKDIYLAYDKSNFIIKKANFSIKNKEFIFIGGKSGSGKSTLIKSLYGQIPLKHGSLKVCDNELFKVQQKQLRNLRQNIGIIFQDYKLIKKFNIEENILLPLKINGYSADVSSQQVKNLLSHVNLMDRAKYYPEQLSGGEQQRVAVARALAHNPRLIIADEPTGNLDDYSAEVIWSLLKGANEQLGITVVVVTHRVPKNFGINFRQLSIQNGVVYEVF